jgi:integrase
MSVRKRKWTTSKGETRQAFIVDYADQDGDRHIRTFAKRADAVAFRATVEVDVERGVHTAPSKSITVAEAAKQWLTYIENEGRERSTLAQYRQHVVHIKPLAHHKLATLTAPRIEQFRDNLLQSMSRPLAKKVLVSLKAIIRDAQRRGQVAQNVALAVKIATSKRDKKKLELGVDIPTPQEITRIIQASENERTRATLFVAALAGLRASELRGLRWDDVKFSNADYKGSPTITISQRADRYNVIGAPKSVAGSRTIPVGPMVANALRLWKLQSKFTAANELVFPTEQGKVQHHQNLSEGAVERPQLKAGIVGADGKPKYGLHSLRHYYASWCINRRANGGLELPLKDVSVRLGHASVQLTADVYGHLFPSADHGAELDAAERAMFAT